MKFVILHKGIIPGFNVHGPVMTPQHYDINLVLKWVYSRIDVREVMPDGSYRKLDCNDERLMEELNAKLAKEAEHKEKVKQAILEQQLGKQHRGNVGLVPEKKVEKPVAKQQPKVEPKKEEPKQEVVEQVEEPKVDLIIDELEKPE